MATPLDPRLRATLASVAACGLLLALAGWAFAGARTAWSVAAGAALATANLWALARIVAALLGDPESSPGETPHSKARRWSLLAVLKMLGLFGLVWLLMQGGLVSPIAMLVGFAALPLGIAIGAIVSDRGGKGAY